MGRRPLKLKSDMQAQNQHTVSGPDHPTGSGPPESKTAKKKIRGDRRESEASDLSTIQDDNCEGAVPAELKSDMHTQGQQTVSGPDHPTGSGPPESKTAKKKIRGDRRESDASDLSTIQDDNCEGAVPAELKSDMHTQGQQIVSGPDHPTGSGPPESKTAKKKIRGDRRESDASDLSTIQDDNCEGAVPGELKSDMHTQSQQIVSGPDHPTGSGPPDEEAWLFGVSTVSGVLAKVIGFVGI